MKFLRLFVFGFIITATVHLLQIVSCSDNSPVSPDNPDIIDMVKVNECAAQIEDAFASGDYKELESILTTQALLNYKDILPELESSKMQEYSALFKKRTFKGGGQSYVEFVFPYEGVSVTAALAIQTDGSYKLMRF